MVVLILMNQQLRDPVPDEPIAKRRFTVDEFEAMGMAGIFGPDERVELIAGEVVAMSPAGRFHEVLRGYLTQHWSRAAPNGVLVMAEMQLRLAIDYQPVLDIGVLPFTILPPDARGQDILLVVEIADSSWKMDTSIKAAAYAMGGVREYWVINARTRETLIHRAPQPEGYSDTFEVAAADISTPLLVPELAIRLSELPGMDA